MTEPANGHVSLRDYVDRIFDEKERALDARLHAEREAVKLAREGIEREMVKLNELRQEVTTDRGRLISREKYDAEVGALKKRLDQADGALMVARFLGAGGLMVALAALLRAFGVVQ